MESSLIYSIFLLSDELCKYSKIQICVLVLCWLFITLHLTTTLNFPKETFNYIYLIIVDVQEGL